MSGNLPTDFGFPIDVHAHEPETIYVVPIKSDSEHLPPEGKLRVFRTRDAGASWQPMTSGLPQDGAYETVLRDGLTTDRLDPVLRAESSSMALLVVLEILSPAERGVFVLHDAFGYPHGEIDILGRCPR